MPKLIIDDNAMQLAITKLAGSPIFSGPGGSLLAPGIVDLVAEEGGGGEDPTWQPANQLARYLVLGGEACRDIVFHKAAAVATGSRQRALKALTVPVCNLMDVVEGLRKSLNDESSRRVREAWPRHDRATYVRIGRRLRKNRLNGPVRKVRHKLGAHLDPEVFGSESVRATPDDLLGAMGDAVILLALSMNYPSEHLSWIRWLGSLPDDRTVVETMFSYPATVRWVVDGTGHVSDVLPVRLAEDPRQQIQVDVYAAISAYNELVKATESSLPTIFTIPTDDLRKVEDARPETHD